MKEKTQIEKILENTEKNGELIRVTVSLSKEVYDKAKASCKGASFSRVVNELLKIATEEKEAA